MKTIGFLAMLLVSLAAQAEARQWLLNADDWARPRDGRSIVQMAPLPELVAGWSAETGQRLVIRYPGGEEGLLWAYELRSWLVALGVPMEAQELVAGSHRADRIELELTKEKK
ncbi:MAG TPA: hypothetical protein ENK49_08650 [Gammaproteobacteria bacterium]|nr:hypothetical protein [Gammaproteobacteria bacterium]